MLEWNVLVGDWNSGEICVHNVFDHAGFLNDCKVATEKYELKADFAEKIKSHLFYYYWCKCEWEVVVCHWPVTDNEKYKCKKIDVYSQVNINWDKFIDYLWEHRAEL